MKRKEKYKILKKIDTPISMFTYLFCVIIVNIIVSALILTCFFDFKVTEDHLYFALLASTFLFMEILLYFFLKLKRDVEADIRKISKELDKLRKMRKYNFYFSTIEKIVATILIVNGFILLTEVDIPKIITEVDGENSLSMGLLILSLIMYFIVVLCHLYYTYILFEVENYEEKKEKNKKRKEQKQHLSKKNRGNR